MISRELSLEWSSQMTISEPGRSWWVYPCVFRAQLKLLQFGWLEPETLLRQADAAMYSAKSLETGVAVYEPWMRKAALLRLNDSVD